MTPTIHHLNCATMCPHGAKLLTGEGGWTETAELVAHVLLIETDQGLVLFDTGLGSGDIADPARTGAVFRRLIRPRYLLAETAIEQIKALGHRPADVRHIAVTHLDVDHAGGLGDFPNAEVHVFETELQAALNPGLREKLRYIQAQWAHGPNWVRYRTSGEQWFGFEAVRAIEGLDPEILIVPLHGHSRGHSGIAVRNSGASERWLLHCGDSYFNRSEIATPPKTPVGLTVFESATEVDRGLRKQNQERLRELALRHGDEIDLFCAHDAVELRRLTAASARVT